MAQKPQSPNSDVSDSDGSVDFSGGVDSIKVTTIQSVNNPNGLNRNELSWLINGSVRDGGITPRGGWKPIKQIGNGSFAYQGGFLYNPIDGSEPYLIFLIGGRVLQCRVDGSPVIDLFNTAYQFTPTDLPSVTLKNIDLVAGSTVNVATDLQAYFGLPASFVAPAINANLTFPTNGDILGQVGDFVIFYGAFTVTNQVMTFDSASLSWKLVLTLQNQSFPPGQTVITTPFMNPHTLVPGVDNKMMTWRLTPFTSPAIGGSVAVTMNQPIDIKIGDGVIGFQTSTQSVQFQIQPIQNGPFVNPPVTPGETITYDSGTNTFIDSVRGIFNFLAVCNKPVMPFNTIIPPQAAVFRDCAAVPHWVFDQSQAIGGSGHVTLTARQPAVAPTNIPANGDPLNFQFGVAQVTNVNKTNFFNYGSSLVKPFFCQGNEFLVIQAGDYRTLPLFWDGQILRKSLGITNNAVAPGTPGVNELPPGGMMDYYMGRLWYSTGPKFDAGDITGGGSGTGNYNFRDAILNVTENPLVLGGDGFPVPANEGNITALSHNASQDNALGQGILFAFTSKGAHGLTVPVTRAAWIAANNQNQPKLVPVQLAMGTASDTSVVPVNGDLYYQDPLANIRTMLTAVRFFGQPGNIPISSNIDRLTQFVDKSLLRFGSGIYFGNRMLQTSLPLQSQQGCVHQALSVLDFESISTFGPNLVPTWEGMYEGLDILQLFTGVFAGEERAFAAVVSRKDFSIQLWELTKDERFDSGDTRIQMQSEFPAFTWGNEFLLKQQIGAELWIDRLYGEVVFLLEYRPDGESCWQKWHEWKVCAPRNSCENTGLNPCTGLSQVLCYPLTNFGESYRQTMTLPEPPQNCSSTSGRPAFVNYQCQPRLTVKGFCRVRGFLLHAVSRERKLYDNKIC